MKSKKIYITVSNKLGNAIMLNTGIDTLIGANIGGTIATENFYIKLGLGLFAISLLLGRRLSQKYIDLNTPSKQRGSPISVVEPSETEIK